VYVSDELRVALRAGQSDQQAILRMLPSGTPLTAIGNDPRAGYTHVRTNDNIEGWVYTAHLMDKPAARERLREIESSMLDLKAETERLRAERVKETDLIDNAQALSRENQSLQSRLTAAETELDVLRNDHDSLRDDVRQRWFLVGAGVLGIGILLGLIIPRLKFRKRSSWGSL
jgi:SH3 domain protein